MNELELQKIQLLIDKLMESRLILQQMIYTVDKLEKELRVHLNKEWEIL